MYGLVVESDEPLGEWPIPRTGSTAAPDVRVKWHEPLPAPDGSPPLFSTNAGGDVLIVSRVSGGTLWRYPDGCRFWVDADAATIQCVGPDDFAAEDLATYLLGPILGYVLRARGHSVLHASTLRIGDRAVAIGGPAGAGKSTLTAALTTRGHRIVAEDVSVLHHTAPTIATGSPLVKLWPDSASRHGELPRLTPNWDKRYLFAPRAESKPLRTIFVLQTAPEVGATRLRGKDALAALLDNAYLAYALTPEQRAADLDRFSRLVEQVAVVRLFRTANYEDLVTLCDLVEQQS